jgi:molecular chaperone GrpE (heat shock protein)
MDVETYAKLQEQHAALQQRLAREEAKLEQLQERLQAALEAAGAYGVQTVEEALAKLPELQRLYDQQVAEATAAVAALEQVPVAEAAHV